MLLQGYFGLANTQGIEGLKRFAWVPFSPIDTLMHPRTKVNIGHAFCVLYYILDEFLSCLNTEKIEMSAWN